jgi:ribosomal protein L7/L12
MLANFIENYAMSITSEAKQEVARLLGQDQKIEAVKYIKESFQVSLRDAKKLVEAIEGELAAGTFKTIATTPPVIIGTPAGLSGETKTHVEMLLRAKRKLEAIRYVRQERKLDLKESVVLVEEVQKQINPNFVASGSGRGVTTIQIAGAGFGLTAVCLLSLAVFFYNANAKLISEGIKTEGTVVRQEWNDDTAAAVIRYQWQGETVEGVNDLYAKPPAYDLGETVVLYVSRENKMDFVVDSFSDRWLGVTILGGMAIIFGFIGVMMLKPIRRF